MKTLFQAEDAAVYFDENQNIFKFVWNGVVSYKSLKPLVLRVRDQCEKIDHGYFIFDRRNLKSYAADARVWLRHDFFKTDGKRLIQKIDKMAAIDSSSALQQVVSGLIVNKIFKFYNPNIQYKFFAREEEATQWLMTKEAKQLSFLGYLGSLFSRKAQV